MWLRHGQPLPDGWKPCPKQHKHHLRYSVMIEKINESE
jgi:hypothetical protein